MRQTPVIYNGKTMLFRYLRNVSVEHVEPAKPKVEFTDDGVLKSAELKIMNLRPGVGNSLVWEEVSRYNNNVCYKMNNSHRP